MGKGKKNQKEISEEEPVKVLPFAYVNGPQKAFVIKTLKRLEKAHKQRVRSKWDPILEAAKKHRDEIKNEEEKDPQLDEIIQKLEEFLDMSDPRVIQEFNNYDNKVSIDPAEQ